MSEPKEVMNIQAKQADAPDMAPTAGSNEADTNYLRGSTRLFERDKYIEWISMPRGERSPETLTQLAEQLGVNPSTLWRWSSEPAVLAEIKRRIRGLAMKFLPAAIAAVGKRAEAEGDHQSAKFLRETAFGEEVAPNVMVKNQIVVEQSLEGMLGGDDEIVLSSSTTGEE